MKKLNKTFKTLLSPLKMISFLVFLSVITIWLTFNFAIEYSSFSVGLAKYTMSIAFVMLVDRFVFKEVNTMKLVKQEPIAYAVFFVGNCLLAAACISTS